MIRRNGRRSGWLGGESSRGGKDLRGCGIFNRQPCYRMTDLWFRWFGVGVPVLSRTICLRWARMAGMLWDVEELLLVGRVKDAAYNFCVDAIEHPIRQYVFDEAGCYSAPEQGNFL